MKNQNHSLDALLLSGIKVSTILINIFSSAILSRMVSLEAYGTYSTGNLIVSAAASVTILGMMDASNYFYHQNQLNKRDCLNTIGFLQLILGAASAAVILLSGDLITAYFRNPMLSGIYIYIAFRPMLENLSNSLLSLQISIGKARAVGVQNLLFSTGKLCAVFMTVFISQDITTILAAYLIMDAVTVCYYYLNFKKADFAINPALFKKDLIAPILRYAVPMGVYVMTTTLARDLDKMVIGHFESTEQLAIYTNCATLLPFGIISSAFLTIIIPAMTRFVQQSRLDAAAELFRDYLSVSFISTAILSVACIILADEAILLLYGEKYLPGKPIFTVYILVDFIKFANVSLVLSAKGKTKTLMCISIGMLAVNGILNLVFYWWMGILGPALATVVATLGTSVVLMAKSGDVLEVSPWRLIDWTKLWRFCALMGISTILAIILRGFLAALEMHFVFRLLIVGILFCGGMCLANLHLIKALFASVNQIARSAKEVE